MLYQRVLLLSAFAILFPWGARSHALGSFFSQWIQQVPSLGLQPLLATTSADNWGFVRQSATWARGNSGLIDGLIRGLKDAGFFQNDGPLTFNAEVNLNGIGPCRIRIELNQTTEFSVASASYSGNKDFRNFLEIKKITNGVEATDPFVQLFFDDPNTTLGNEGALIYYRLREFGDARFADVGDVITESYTANDSVYGTKFQTYTWRGGPENSAWISEHGRVVLTEVDENRQLCFRSVVKLNWSKLELINPQITGVRDLCRGALGQNTGTADPVYYVLAYMQKFASPFLTTAKATFTTDSSRPETICNLNASLFPTAKLSYGIFNLNGFVDDQLSASQVPAEYPHPTIGGTDFMSVAAAFERTYVAEGDTPLNTGSTTVLGPVESYEDTSKAFFDDLDAGTGPATNLVFKSIP